MHMASLAYPHPFVTGCLSFLIDKRPVTKGSGYARPIFPEL